MTPQELLETPDLIAVGIAGDEVRRRMHGPRTTFNRVFEVHVDAPPQALPGRVHAGEFRIVGKPANLETLVAAVRATVALAGTTPVTVFSVADLLSLRHSIRQVADELKQAGAAAVVQLELDLVEAAPLVAADIRDAGLELLTIAVHELDDQRRLEVCHAATALQKAVEGLPGRAGGGAFRAFAPLPRQMSVTKPTTGYDDVKTIALARTMVTNIQSIQVDWALYGPKLAQVALTVGANDIDTVAAVDPGILGTRRSPLEEVKGNIYAAALEPVERDGLFNAQGPTPNAQSRAD